MTIEAYLKKGKGHSLIVLKTWYNKSEKLPFVFSTGERIDPDHWDRDGKMADEKKGKQYRWLNAAIKRYKDAAMEYYWQCLAVNTRPPTHEELRAHLLNIKDEMQGVSRDRAGEVLGLMEYMERHLQRLEQDPEVSEHTSKMYRTLIRNLERYRKQNKRVKLDFKALDLQWFESWQNWNYDNGLAKNTVAGYWKRFKRVLNEATEDGLYDGTDHTRRSLAISFQEADEIYFNTQELMDIYRLDLSEAPHLEKYRDVFLFNAFAGGWRFSDLGKIGAGNIVALNTTSIVKFHTQKTDEAVYIPSSWYFKEFMEKYGRKMPKFSSQKFNGAIKEIARLAGLTEPVTLRKNEGGKNVKVTKQKWEWAHQYTARYSFAYALDEAGIPLLKIRDLMGHKNVKTTERYIKRGKMSTVKSLIDHPFFAEKPAQSK